MLSIELLELKLRTSSLALSRLHITLVSVSPAPYSGKLLKSDYQVLSLCFSTVQFIPKMADMFSELLKVTRMQQQCSEHKIQKCYVRGWEDSSAKTVLASHTQGHEFDP